MRGKLLTRWIAPAALVLSACAFSNTTLAGEAESTAPSLPDLPEKLRDNYEIDRLKREIELKQLQIQLEQLQGPQDSDLQRRINQAADLERLLEAKKRIDELIIDSPEYAPLVEQILGVDPTPPTCACLDQVRVHGFPPPDGPARPDLSLNGRNVFGVDVGSSIGGSACQLLAATADSVTVGCQGSERALRLIDTSLPGSR